MDPPGAVDGGLVADPTTGQVVLAASGTATGRDVRLGGRAGGPRGRSGPADLARPCHRRGDRAGLHPGVAAARRSVAHHVVHLVLDLRRRRRLRRRRGGRGRQVAPGRARHRPEHAPGVRRRHLTGDGRLGAVGRGLVMLLVVHASGRAGVGGRQRRWDRAGGPRDGRGLRAPGRAPRSSTAGSHPVPVSLVTFDRRGKSRPVRRWRTWAPSTSGVAVTLAGGCSSPAPTSRVPPAGLQPRGGAALCGGLRTERNPRGPTSTGSSIDARP